jgi:hypothetical protein
VVKVDFRALQISFLVQRRFGWVGSLSEMRRRQLATPSNDVDAYRAELDRLGPAALDAAYAAELEKQRTDEEAKAQRLTADRAAREAGYAYNFPADPATYSYWSKASYWTLNEAIMLAVGDRKLSMKRSCSITRRFQISRASSRAGRS